MSLLTASHLHRRYTIGDVEVPAVVDVNLSLETGDFVALVGPSGCGKSTLLHLCGAMDRPTSGSVSLDDVALDRLSDDELTAIRCTKVGFVFQFFNLLPTLSALENVELPLLLAGAGQAAATAAAGAIVDRVGLGHRAKHYPKQLSGGEMQRVAVARALVHRPALLIADEPTGNLDSENGLLILELLRELNRETGVAMLLATHAAEIASAAGRIVRMRDGRIESIVDGPGSAFTLRNAEA